MLTYSPLSPGGGIPQQVVVTRELITTQVSLIDFPSAIGVGQSITMKANVTRMSRLRSGDALPITGTISFVMDDTVPLGSMPLVNGLNSLTLPSLPVGSHTIRVVFGGGPNDDMSKTDAVPISVFGTGSLGLAIGVALGQVQVLDAHGGVVTQFAPFGAAYTGGVNVAMGNILGHTDGTKDLVVAAAVGNPNVKVYNGAVFLSHTFDKQNPEASVLFSFFPYKLGFNVGTFVAVGDIENDGFADIVTGATVGNPDVRVYSGKDIANKTFNPYKFKSEGGSLLTHWYAYGLNFNIGATVAVGDLDHDGYADVVTGASAGNPHVKVFSGKAIATGTFSTENPDASLLAQFFPFAMRFNVGAYVAVGDVNGDGYADLIAGASVGNPQVKVYDGKAIAAGNITPETAENHKLDEFFAFAAGQNIGVTVGALDYESNGMLDILTGSTATARYRLVRGNSTGVLPPAVNGFDYTLPYQGGVNVGA